jgi:hypothetical protein
MKAVHELYRTRSDDHRAQFRSYMTALCFNTGFRPLLETNLERPTVICAGVYTSSCMTDAVA